MSRIKISITINAANSIQPIANASKFLIAYEKLEGNIENKAVTTENSPNSFIN